MSHGHDHLEEAEHAQHASHDPFDRRVAMTMVIVAAALAIIKLLGHRSHSDTILYQIQTDVHHTKEADQWNFFQAQKMRQHLYESQGELLQSLQAARGGNDSEGARRAEAMKGRAQEYAAKAEKIKEEAEQEQKEAEQFQIRSERSHHRSDYFDLGELGVELALVVCSVSILTRRVGYWYGGIVLGVLGGLVALGGIVLR